MSISFRSRALARSARRRRGGTRSPLATTSLTTAEPRAELPRWTRRGARSSSCISSAGIRPKWGGFDDKRGARTASARPSFFGDVAGQLPACASRAGPGRLAAAPRQRGRRSGREGERGGSPVRLWGYTGPRLSAGVVDRVRGDFEPAGGARSDAEVRPGQAAAEIWTRPSPGARASGGEESDASQVEVASCVRFGIARARGIASGERRSAGCDAVVLCAAGGADYDPVRRSDGRLWECYGSRWYVRRDVPICRWRRDWM